MTRRMHFWLSYSLAKKMMVSWWLCRSVLFTIVCFLYGYRIGKIQTPTTDATTINPCNIVPSTTLPLITTTMVASLCPAEETIHTIPSTTVTLKIGNKTMYDHCTESPYNMNKMFLQLAPSTVPDDIFPMLHHPGTPASMTFVMTQGQSWPTHKPIQTACSELYLTRTGSRSSQPNKCVAIMKVPVGVESNIQSSYRYGFTALLTNQYRNDYPTEKTFHEELVLMPPLLKVLASLQEEFTKKMGNPLAADGTRRAVIVMVANEGVACPCSTLTI